MTFLTWNRCRHVSDGNYGSVDDTLVIRSYDFENVGSEASIGSPRCEKGKFFLLVLILTVLFLNHDMCVWVTYHIRNLD